MKKFVFFTLLSICVTAIAITSGNSQQKSMYSSVVNNIKDTTPKTHHSMIRKPMSDTVMHKTMTKKTTAKTKTTKDSTQKK